MTKDGEEKASLATVPLLDVINDLPELIMQAIHPYFMPKPQALGLFKPLKQQIEANDERAGGELPPAEEDLKALAGSYLTHISAALRCGHSSTFKFPLTFPYPNSLSIP